MIEKKAVNWLKDELNDVNDEQFFKEFIEIKTFLPL